MMKLKDFPLEGSHVTLELLQETHRETIKSISRDAKVSVFSPSLEQKFDSWFDKALKSDVDSRQLTFVVRTLHDQKMVGSTRFYEIHPEYKRLAIGYTWYVPEVWGSVVNAECKLLLLRYVFETLHYNRVEFFVDSRNDRSRAAVKKLGATEEGLLRQHIVLDDNYVRDTVVFSILKNEWPAILQRLQKRLML